MNPEITYRPIEKIEELNQIIQLQEHVWDKSAITPFAHIIAVNHNGGTAIGAFHGKKVVGFCYGFPGYDGKEPYLYSHMMGIHSDYRNLGIGKKLKFKQREWALKNGYKKIFWTYDPLEARNGYLNLNKLGAIVDTYLPSYYGEMQDSLNKGLPSDRFLIEWRLLDPHVVKLAEGIDGLRSLHSDKYPLLLSTEGGKPSQPPRENETGYLVPVPADVQKIKRTSIEDAKAWRMQLRDVFQRKFAEGYYVSNVLLDKQNEIHRYILEGGD